MFRSLSVQAVTVVSVIALASVVMKPDLNRLNERHQSINAVELGLLIMRTGKDVSENEKSKK
ncbi:MAG: hypothetical protein DRQ44_09625 [Gammaproteobacteria bacterium]|nr:MAG: hypothetical protein DRQ44_09625 [Gammaproteobacteria bacterium]